MNKALNDLLDMIHLTENIATEIHSVREESRIFKIVTEKFLHSGQYIAGILLLDSNNSTLKISEITITPDKVGALEESIGCPIEQLRIDVINSRLFSELVSGKETLQASCTDILKDVFTDERSISTAIQVLDLEGQNAILTPLCKQDKEIGVLIICINESNTHFVPVVKNLARHIMTALELADVYAEHERTEQALQHSETYFRSLIENAPDVIGIIDADGNLRYMSPSLERISGFTTKELTGKNIFELMHPDEVSSALELFAHGIEIPDYMASMEIRLQHKDGSWRIVEFVAQNLLNEKSVEGIVVNCRDITDRKLAEIALQESEEKYRTLFENVGIPITYFNLDGIALLANNAGAANSGITPDLFVGKSVYETLPSTADLIVGRIKHIGETGLGAQYEDAVEFPNGKRWFFADLQPVRDANGQIFAVQIISQDITDRKQAEEQLRTQHKNLESIVNERTSSLEEANTALRVMLKAADEARAEIEDTLLFNIKKTIMPFVEELNTTELNDVQKQHLKMVTQGLETITSPLLQRLPAHYLPLTPTEVMVIGLIKQGHSTKEIATLLNMSTSTVETHRHNIRTKLGLKYKGINLRKYVSSYDNP